MQMQIKLEAFNGPLDLLLSLIEKNKVDIYDIPIAQITNQYMDALKQLEIQDLEQMSEFLVMAATLLEIKSKMLLPKTNVEEEIEEDPRRELARRLLEYKMFKEIAGELLIREPEAKKNFYRLPELPKEVIEYKEPINLDKVLADLDLQKLHQVFERVIKLEKERKDPVRSEFKTIRREQIKLTDKIKQILDKCQNKKHFYFNALLEKADSRLEIIVTFLAVLELMKVGSILVTQEGIFEEIYIETVEEKFAEGKKILNQFSRNPVSFS